MRKVEIHLWQIALAFLAVTAAFAIQGVLLTLTIQDVNRSRLASCVRTYEGVREVFRPFFRPVAERTPKERHDIAKFDRIVDRLKARCDKQTATKGTP